MTIPGWKSLDSNEGGPGWGRPEHSLLDDDLSSTAVEAGFACETRPAFDSERSPGTQPAKYLNRTTVRVGNRIVLLSVRDIFWVQSHGNFLRLHMKDATYEHRMTIKDICKRLDPDRFVRVHRSAIVNLDHVVEFDLPRYGNAFVRLRNGKAVPISGTGRLALRRGLLVHSCAPADTGDPE